MAGLLAFSAGREGVSVFLALVLLSSAHAAAGAEVTLTNATPGAFVSVAAAPAGTDALTPDLLGGTPLMAGETRTLTIDLDVCTIDIIVRLDSGGDIVAGGADICANPALRLATDPAIDPPLGVPVAEFADFITDRLAEKGDAMGFSLDSCALSPGFLEAEETYLSRAFTSGGTEAEIALVAVEEGLVRAWREYDLPDFAGWVTHFSRRCDGDTLVLSESGEEAFRYAWDGVSFSPVPLAGE